MADLIPISRELLQELRGYLLEEWSNPCSVEDPLVKQCDAVLAGPPLQSTWLEHIQHIYEVSYEVGEGREKFRDRLVAAGLVSHFPPSDAPSHALVSGLQAIIEGQEKLIYHLRKKSSIE